MATDVGTEISPKIPLGPLIDKGGLISRAGWREGTINKQAAEALQKAKTNFIGGKNQPEVKIPTTPEPLIQRQGWRKEQTTKPILSETPNNKQGWTEAEVKKQLDKIVPKTTPSHSLKSEMGQKDKTASQPEPLIQRQGWRKETTIEPTGKP